MYFKSAKSKENPKSLTLYSTVFTASAVIKVSYISTTGTPLYL